LTCGGSDRNLKRDDPQSRLSGQMRSGIECRVYSRGQLCCVSTATGEKWTRRAGHAGGMNVERKKVRQKGVRLRPVAV
jgi:hypothetical protein